MAQFVFVSGDVFPLGVVLGGQLAPVLGLVVDQVPDDLPGALLLLRRAFAAVVLQCFLYMR